MATGTDIAARLPAKHTAERERVLLQAVADGEIVPVGWSPVPVSHRFHDGSVIRGTVFVMTRALRLGAADDCFRPTVNQVTAQKMADALRSLPAACAPEGVLLPTAKVMDDAARASTVKVDVCLQSPDAGMADTARMLEHSRCVDRSIGSRAGLTNTEGKGWRNTSRLNGRPDLEANYGLYCDGARYRSVTGMALWQPDPGVKHISGYGSAACPQGYTDYSQGCEKWMKAIMDVEGMGRMDVPEVARHPRLCWLISTEGPVSMRHPALPEPAKELPAAPALAPALPILTRTVCLSTPRMCGEDVAFIQRLCGAVPDKVFGPQSRAAVERWQASHCDLKGEPLVIDGVVGPRTRAAMLAAVGAAVPGHPSGFAPGTFDVTQARYTEARYYDRAVRRERVHWIVIHAAEAAELPSTAEALARYCATMADGRRCSWHWAFDCDSATQSVEEDRVAYHASRANRFGVGYEHAGYSRASRSEWTDEYSCSMLWISAQVAAKITGPRWGIPLDNFVGAQGLVEASRLIEAGKAVPDRLRGLTTHAQVTAGLGGTHTDPGAGFPMDLYLKMIDDAA